MHYLGLKKNYFSSRQHNLLTNGLPHISNLFIHKRNNLIFKFKEIDLTRH